MKKFFEDPTIEIISLQTESVADTGLAGGSTGTSTDLDPDVPAN